MTRETPERWPAAMLIAKAGEYLDCSRTTVERLIRDGEFPAIAFTRNGDRRVLKTDLDAYLERVRNRIPKPVNVSWD